MELRELINKRYQEVLKSQKTQSVCFYRNASGQEFRVYVNPPLDNKKVTCTSKTASRKDCEELAKRLAKLIM